MREGTKIESSFFLLRRKGSLRLLSLTCFWGSLIGHLQWGLWLLVKIVRG